MMEAGSLIAVVDDDESLRESLPDLLRELGFAVEVFSSGEEFLAFDGIGRTSCVILDIAMPGLSGPDVQRALQARAQDVPIVFITAHADSTLRSQLIQQGAVDCLFKPFTESALIEAIQAVQRRG